jgi:hypothetical protein
MDWGPRPIVNKLFTIWRSSYLNTRALAVASVVCTVLLLALIYITSINIGLYLQQESELFTSKTVLGDNADSEHDKKMNILPCDAQHACQTST